jgi:superoxide dismutase, Fe-Mn family
MGSGWGWLGWDRVAKSLRVLELPNQEMLGPEGCAPLLTIDVWEHAYYVDYKNLRADYVKQIWKVVNWKVVGERMAKAAK